MVFVFVLLFFFVGGLIVDFYMDGVLIIEFLMDDFNVVLLEYFGILVVFIGW